MFTGCASSNLQFLNLFLPQHYLNLLDSCTVEHELKQELDSLIQEITPMRPWAITDVAEYYFCTDTIVGRRYIFSSPHFFKAIIDSFWSNIVFITN